MRIFPAVFALALLLPAAAAGFPGAPVAGVNFALEHEGREVAATTTLGDGEALLQAETTGEYGLLQQNPSPADALLTVTVGAEEPLSTMLLAGRPSAATVIEFPARAGDPILIRLERLEAADPR